MQSDLNLSLDLFSGSADPRSGLEASERSRQCDGPAAAAALVVAKQPTLYTRVLTRFCIAWEVQYGKKYVPTPADKSQLGRLLSDFPVELEEELCVSFSAYCSGLDKFEGEAHRHSLKWFCTNGGFNKYRTTPRTAGMSQRELNGANAAERYVEMRRGAK